MEVSDKTQPQQPFLPSNHLPIRLLKSSVEENPNYLNRCDVQEKSSTP